MPAMLEIVVQSHGAGRGAPLAREIEAIRERLSQLYPAGSRIDARCERATRRAVLNLPLPQAN